MKVLIMLTFALGVLVGMTLCVLLQIAWVAYSIAAFLYRIMRVDVYLFIKRWKMHAYVALGFLVLLLGSTGTAYVVGGKHTANRILAEQKKAQDQIIEQHKKDALADMQAIAEVERKHAQHQQQVLKRRHALELDIERKRKERHAAESSSVSVVHNVCDLDAGSYGLLIDSIKAANRAATGRADSVPAPVPADSGTGERR